MRKKFLIDLFFTLFFLAVFFGHSELARANNVTGWAWSSNVGWISFNSQNPPESAQAFGVNIGTDGNMTGFAWSSSIGWIHFDPAGPYPQAPSYSARVDRDGNLTGCGGRGLICGWARACSVFQSGCSGALTPSEARGGWEGWIFLGPAGPAATPHGVRLRDIGGRFELRGYAWGSEPLGWINFNCIDNGNCTLIPFRVETTYILNSPPEVLSSTSTLRYCDHGVTPQAATGLTVTLNWEYFDRDGNPQSQYEIHISQDSNFPSANRFTKVTTSSVAGYTLDPAHSTTAWKTALSWNTTYHWRVRVHDGNLWSENWRVGSFLVARTRPSPLVAFFHSPQRISVGEVVTFNGGGSLVYDGTTPRYRWTFSGGNPGSVTSTSTATTTFTQPGNFLTTLEVTDGNGAGYSCSLSRTLQINVPVPDWREIVPFGKIEIILANVIRRIFGS